MRSRSGLGGRGGDDGFTLIELLVAIVIMGVITVPLANVVIGYFRSADATTARLIESHDVQIASAYWAQDVASIGTRDELSPYGLKQSVEENVLFSSSLFPCGTPGTTPLVSLAWDQFSDPGVAATLVRVAYVVVPMPTGPKELHRLRCEGPSATPFVFTLVSDVILAHSLDTSAVTPAAVACSTDCTLTLNLKDPQNLGVAYVFTLTGQRRQQP